MSPSAESRYEVYQVSEDLNRVWDEIVETSVNGTFIHTRSYVAHQRGRFDDLSAIVYKDSQPLAVLPVVRDPASPQQAVSHLGLTYGGLLRPRGMGPSDFSGSLNVIRSYLTAMGIDTLHYREVPSCFYREPDDLDQFQLIRAGAHLRTVSLNAVVDLSRVLNYSSRKKRNLRKGLSLDLQKTDGRDAESFEREIRRFYDVLTVNLAQRFQTKPTHSLGELLDLSERFVDQVALFTASSDDVCLGGTLVYKTDSCWHAQYISSTDHGRTVGAADAALDSAIQDAQANGRRWFSLGVSDDPTTGKLNAGLFGSKLEFGASPLAHRTWTLPLNDIG